MIGRTEIVPDLGIDDVVVLLQLLGQRATVEDATTKAVVTFQVHENLFTVTVQMITLAPAYVVGQPMPAAKHVYSATGKSYDEAAKALVDKLAEPLQSRQTEDSQVLALLKKVARTKEVKHEVREEASDNGADFRSNLPKVR